MKLTPWQLAIARGKTLMGWQIESLESFGRGYPTALITANGAGKTWLAASAVDWFFSKHPKGWLVATSSSFNQLQNQTWASMATQLPGNFEVRRASSPLRIKAPGGGEGIGFSTKDAGRAEGWHPKQGPDVDPVMILIDEAKTVPDAIWTAFDRCTVAYSLIISSAGPPVGRFFDCFHSLKKYYWTRKVPSDECPHIPAWKRERDRELMPPDKFASAHSAEFTMDGQFLIIDPEALQAAILLQPTANEIGGETVAFFDFARGGDENVFALRRGNRVRIVEAWRQRDTVQAVRRFIHLANSNNVKPHQCYGDADGLGGPMVDQFRDENFPINEFHGGSKPLDAENYSNLISEVWIQGCRRIQRGDFNIGEPDPETKRQLTTRLFQWDAKGKKKAESKEDMAKRGLGSPDRADAILGCIGCGSWMNGAVTADSFHRQPVSDNPFGAGLVTGW
jgi:hypothetical protein